MVLSDTWSTIAPQNWGVLVAHLRTMEGFRLLISTDVAMLKPVVMFTQTSLVRLLRKGVQAQKQKVFRIIN